MSKRQLLVLAVLFAVLRTGSQSVSAESLSPERQRQIVQSALRAFDQATEQSRPNPAEAQRLYREAAAGFAALADSGIRNAGLQYNLGNTHFRLGDRGRAILHYRRGLALDPRHAALRDNLAYVRGQVTPAIPEPAQSAVLRGLLFWHYDTTMNSRFWAAAALSAAGWLVLLALLRWRRRPAPLVAVAVLLAIGGAIAGGSVIFQQQAEARHGDAVIVSGEQTLRLGRGESYEPAMKQPLGPGVELRILGERADWVEVRLANGQTGWLPARAVERVQM